MGLWQILKGEQPGLLKSVLHYRNAGQFGEYLIDYALQSNGIEGERVVLTNLYLPMKGKTTEIDLLMLHEKGIFVIESKYYSGWIFGSEDQLKWTQCFRNGRKEHFYNPVKQNRTHIRALAEYLSMPEEAFSSYVVFSERCTLKKVPRYFDGDITVCHRHTMLCLMRKRIKDAPVVYSHADIERLAGLLRPLTEVAKEEKQQHIEDLKTKCPFCGQPLVMRHGRNGAFWGCSSYPKCRYTRSLDGTVKLTATRVDGRQKRKVQIPVDDAEYIFNAFVAVFSEYKKMKVLPNSGFWKVRLLTDEDEVFFYHGANGQERQRANCK